MHKRKDSKGRLLREGEIQRSDGKYEYRYYNMAGERKSVYSWRLVETDPTPRGKQHSEPLRTMIDRITQAEFEQVDICTAQQTSVNDYLEKFLSLKTGIKPQTMQTYRSLYSTHLKNAIGMRKLSEVKYSDIKAFYTTLIRDSHLRVSTLKNVDILLSGAFRMAYRDGLIRTNPTTDVVRELKQENGLSVQRRKALTPEQQEEFVEFVSTSRRYQHWMPLFTVLLGTGMRIGEALGLRWEDCDMENSIITVDHTLYRIAESKRQYRNGISTPKTEAGVRKIPMISSVKAALDQQYSYALAEGFCVDEIDGYHNFVFCSDRRHVYIPSTIDAALASICRAYNKRETERAKEEHRPPHLLPKISAHILRHTFCTRFCEQETDIKVIQKIMGHATISVTMDVYNEVNDGRELYALSKLEHGIRVS